MKKLTLICLIYLFGNQFINAQVLSVCGPEPQITDTQVNITVSGGTGPYTWYYQATCAQITTREQCQETGSCFWMFGQCLVGSGSPSDWFWVDFATGTTVAHSVIYNGDTKVVDALGNELIFIHSINSPNLETCSALGIENNTIFSNVSIFPNPNQGIVNVNFGDLKNVDLKIFNPIGQLIYHKENVNEKVHQFELEGASGIYFIELSTQQGRQGYKLSKN